MYNNILVECIDDLLKNRQVNNNCMEKLMEVSEYREVYDSLVEIRNAIIDISKGKLDYEVKSKGYFPSAVKNLQSTLLHLMWQTKVISSGNFSQSVDFLGEFSDAFNTMTEQVEDHIEKIKNLENESRESKEHFEAIFNTSPDITMISKIDGKIVDANQAFFKIFGYDREEIIGRSFREIGLIKNTANSIEMIEELLSKKECKNAEYSLITASNQEINVLNSSKIVNLKGEERVISVSRDITDLKRAQEIIRESEEKYRLLTEFTSDVIWVLNLTTRKFTYVSPSIYNLRGITAKEAMNETLDQTMLSRSFQNEMKSLERNSKKFLENPDLDNSYTYEMQQPHKDGSSVWVEASIKYRYNDSGDLEIVGSSRNIDKRKKSEEEVLYLSYHDQLTGLYNRRFYEEKLKTIDNESNLPITLIMGDVNGLKLTNDAFGHLAGDTLLKRVAQILKEECRETDIISRTGGDEFVIILAKTDSSYAEKLLKRIKNSFSKVVINNIALSVSLGYQTKENIDEEIEKVYARAEDHMYNKKLSESKDAKKKTIKLIIDNIYAKDKSAKNHAENVKKNSQKMGQALNLEDDVIESLGIAGLLHDIGKVIIDEETFKRTGELSEVEWEDMKKHPEIGYQILRSINDFAHIADWVLSHHERLDGTGYPRGIKNNEIPLYSKIFTIVDSYEAMTSERVYKEKLSQEEAIEEIKANLGTQFDEELSRVFVEKVLLKKW